MHHAPDLYVDGVSREDIDEVSDNEDGDQGLQTVGIVNYLSIFIYMFVFTYLFRVVFYECLTCLSNI